MQINNVREIVKGCKDNFGCGWWGLCKHVEKCNSIFDDLKAVPCRLSESEIQQLEKGE